MTIRGPPHGVRPNHILPRDEESAFLVVDARVSVCLPNFTLCHVMSYHVTAGNRSCGGMKQDGADWNLLDGYEECRAKELLNSSLCPAMAMAGVVARPTSESTHLLSIPLDQAADAFAAKSTANLST